MINPKQRQRAGELWKAIRPHCHLDAAEGRHWEFKDVLLRVSPPLAHGVEGTGGLGKNLHDNNFIQSQSDEELAAFLLKGRQGTAMDGFEGILAPEDLGYLVTLIRAWQK
jgi:hypothetical protein